ncbi:uncharacterized protein LY89DRAFT_787259 [Mollisia scopiformis]|uniref:Uncharacterized protein n=1 Tax=Mollisia scopiformis TaxID=149040 RepID=A0A194WTJ0_MOLSC|nr:uncharacterized protein LY89DRAFT_787259 [Mollisia scopiformis]KUJ10932.1 hypothetical protein LY89DRAFT_787259 [Mollisia scopiformis]
MADGLAIIGVVLPLAGLATTGIRELCELYAAKKEISETIQNVSKQLPLLIDTLTEIEKRLQVELLKPTAQKIFVAKHQNNIARLVEGCRTDITKLNSLIVKVKPSGSAKRSRAFQVSKKAVAWRLRYGNEFKEIMSRLRNLTSTLTDYLTVRSGIIVDESLSLALKGREHRYTDWLQPCDVEFIGKKLDGTSPPDSDRLLCIYGVHGSGKSVLASSIVSGLKDRQQKTLFFSFSGLESTRKSVEHLLRTILWQLIQIAPPEVGHKTMQDLMAAGAIATAGLLQSLVKIGKSLTTRVYCIIDGVDESDAEWNDSFDGGLKIVLDLRKALPGFHFLLIGRPAALWQALRHTDLKIEMTPQAVKGDIAKFIQAEIEKLDIVNNDNLRTHVYKTLEEKSDGMFLWVKMMLSELRKASTADEVEKMLSDLPRGLHKAYHFVFASLLGRLGKLELSRAQRLLQIVVTACRPMKIGELCYTYAIMSEHGAKFEKHLMPQPDQGVLNVCGDFITISGGVVRLGHTSVKEFLTRSEEQFRLDDPELLCFNINITKANHMMALTWIEYLATCEYGFPLRDADAMTTLDTRYPLLHYASRYGVFHLMRSVHDVSNADLVQELDLLQEWYDQAIDKPRHLRRKFHGRMEEELEYRRKLFGDEDERTETCRSAVLWLIDDVEKYLPDNSQSQSLIVSAKASSPADKVSQMMNILSSGSMFSIQKQAGVLLGLGKIWKGPKGLTDPLDILFNMLLSTADRLPIYALSGLGYYYERLGKMDQALKIYRAALVKLEDKENVMECVTLGQIGYILNTMERYDESEEAFRQEVRKRQRIFGETHSTTLAAQVWLAQSLYDQDKLDESKDVVLEVQEKSERALGKNNAVTLDNLKLLGQIQLEDDDLEEAELTLREIAKRKEQKYGKDNTNTLQALYNVADFLYNRTRNNEAEMISRPVLEIQGKKLGLEHSQTLDTLDLLAFSLYYQEQLEEALELFQKQTTVYEKISGRTHSRTLETLQWLFQAHLDMRNYTEAENTIRDLIGRHETEYGRDNFKTMKVVYQLGLVLELQGRDEEAEIQFRDTVNQIDAALQVGYHEALSWFAALAGVHGTKDGSSVQFEKTRKGLLGLEKSYAGMMRDIFLIATKNVCTCGKDLDPEEIIAQPVASDDETRKRITSLRSLFCELTFGPDVERNCVKAEELYQAALKDLKDQKEVKLEDLIRITCGT